MVRQLRYFLLGGLFLPVMAVLSAEPSPADAAKLREIKEVFWPKAYREGDTALLDKILADQFQLIDAEGTISTKREELDYVRKNKPTYKSFRFEITRLEVFENRTAIVSGTGRMEFDATAKTEAHSIEYKSSNVFIERDGRWQAIASHVSGVKKTER
jgi:hypothetical protein